MCCMTKKTNNKMPGVVLEHQKAVDMRGLTHILRAVVARTALTLPKSHDGYILDIYHWISRAASGYPFTFLLGKIASRCDVILWNRVGGSNNDHTRMRDASHYFSVVHFPKLVSSGSKS